MSQGVKGLRPGMWCKPKDKQEWQLLRHLAKMIWPYSTTYQDKEDEWHFRPYARHSIVAVINDEPIAATPDWAHEGRPMVSVPEFIARCYEQAEINKNKEADRGSTTFPVNYGLPDDLWDQRNCDHALGEISMGAMQRFLDHEKRIKALEEALTIQLGQNEKFAAAWDLSRAVQERVSKLEGKEIEVRGKYVALLFEEAFPRLREGAAIRRRIWPETTLLRGGSSWVPTMNDMLAGDWEVLPE